MSKRLTSGLFRSKNKDKEAKEVPQKSAAKTEEVVVPMQKTEAEPAPTSPTHASAPAPTQPVPAAVATSNEVKAVAPASAPVAPLNRMPAKIPPRSPSRANEETKQAAILPASPGDNDTMVFENEEGEEEEDTTILNMSLIRNLLGPSTSNIIEDANKMEGAPSALRSAMVKNVSFSGVESVGSAKEDEDKSHDELVQKIGKVQAKLTQLEIEKSAERAMRKKKDKSLVKLAKELNKRAADQQKNEKSIIAFKGLVADLEAKLAATRSEMDERIASNEKKTKEYNDELDAAHKKYRIVVAVNDTKVADLNKTHVEATESLRRTSKEAEIECERLRTQIGSARDQVEEKVAENEKLVEAHTIAKAESLQKYKDVVKDHEKRIADMINKHEDQTDDLRRQLLSANLECDKIRAELASLQMLAAPHDADAIVSRTMRSASFKMPQKSATKRIIPVLQISSAVMVVVIAIAYQLGLLSMNAMCAPVMPGSTLADDASALFGAPWWVPANFKEQAFGAICGDRPRASLKFSSGRLVVADEATAKMLLDKRSEIVAVQGNVINFFDRKGKIDSLRSPWAI